MAKKRSTGEARRELGFREHAQRALGFGLLAGALELALMLAQRSIDPRISMDSLRTNQHDFWMTPASTVALTQLLGVLLALLARSGHPWLSRPSWKIYAGVGVFGPLLAIEGLYPAAAALLACGLGYRLGPWAEQLADRKPRLCRVAVQALGAGLIAWIAIGSFAVGTAEWRTLAALPEPTPGARNVIMLVLDNVRAESLSLQGRERPTSPSLERIAEHGVLFQEARATAPWTLPSHASMFTGQWSHELNFGWDRALDGAKPTLAEFLSSQGYATAGFVANTYYCNRRYGLNRGFARYEDCYENATISPFEILRSSGLGKLVFSSLGFPMRVDKGGTSVRKTAEMLNRDALAWLDARPQDRPFLLFVNYYDAHGPFVPPAGPDPRFGLAALPKPEQDAILSRYVRATKNRARPEDGPREAVERQAMDLLRDSYESCIAYLDRQIGELYGELGRRGLLENTLVMITSDHGEHFQERGFSGHGLSVYRREVHVPLVIVPPGGLPEGRVVEQPVSLRDLAASSADVLGLNDLSPFPGRSLARFWLKDGRSEAIASHPILSRVRQQTRLSPAPHVPATLGSVTSMVAEGKVYIRNSNGREELYDLSRDRDERFNLAESARLDDFRTALAEHIPGEMGETSEAQVAERDVERVIEDSRIVR